MPLRLGLSITSLRRVFGEVATDDGFLLLTQDGNAILSQRGEFFVTEDAPISADFLETQDALLTQAGDFIALNQNTLQILTLNHDVETTGRVLTTQDFNGVITQDGKGLITPKDA
jgi:hypothetical protein